MILTRWVIWDKAKALASRFIVVPSEELLGRAASSRSRSRACSYNRVSDLSRSLPLVTTTNPDRDQDQDDLVFTKTIRLPPDLSFLFLFFYLSFFLSSRNLTTAELRRVRKSGVRESRRRVKLLFPSSPCSILGSLRGGKRRSANSAGRNNEQRSKRANFQIIYLATSQAICYKT